MITVNVGGIIHQSLIDWDGMVVDVVMFNGCNIRCGYCHNHELIHRRHYKDAYDVMSDVGFDFIDGVVFSGGEPTLQQCALELMMDITHDEGKKVAIETNGTRPEVIDDLAPYIDQLFIDFKSNPFLYNTDLIGIDKYNLMYTFDSMKLADELSIPLELRTTCFSNLIDEWDIKNMGTFIHDTFDNEPTWVLQQGQTTDVLENNIFDDSVIYSPEQIEKLARIGKEYVDNMYYTTKVTGRIKV